MISFPAKSEGWPKRALLTSISVGLLVLLSPNISESNTAPTIQPIGDKTAIEGELLSFAITATDPDSPPQTLTFTPEFGFPYNATLTPDGVFEWTPDEFSVGGATFGVIVRVTDNGEPPLSDTELFFITTVETNEPPTLITPGTVSMNLGTTTTFSVSATDPDIPPNALTLSLLEPTPPSASISPTVFNSAEVSWTPEEFGEFVFRIRVEDGNGGDAEADVLVTVLPAANNPPTILPIGDQTAVEGQQLTFVIMATDPDSPPQTLTFTPEFGFPEDASLTPDGVFSWTPNEFWGGAVFGVIVRVTDNGDPPLSDTQLFFISVEEVSEIALIEQLIADVEALAASGELKSNQVNGLLGKLREAIKKLETGQPTAACNKLGEFIVQVESLISAKKLNATDGQQLITSAEGIAALLDCESSSAAGTARSSPEAIPAAFALSQNRPNPFQQQTEMILRLPASTEYALTIHDVAGRLIRRYSGSAGPGEVVLRWEGTNEAGDRVQPGVYFYRLCAGTHEETKSMLLLPR